jgi:hypothetical protein
VIVDQRNHSIVAFNQCSAALDPVTAIVIRDGPEFSHCRAVNVAAQHGVYVGTLGVMSHGGFELTDEAHSIFTVRLAYALSDQ